MKNTIRTPHFLTLIASLGLLLAPVAGCEKDPGTDAEDETTGDGDGDGDMTGDGDGDPTGDGDGDGDPTGDGDGDGDPTGDGDGEPVMCEPGNGGAPRSRTRRIVWRIGFGCQLCAELPEEPHDRRMDAVLLGGDWLLAPPDGL